ncbi:transcriptional activator MN1 [Denticeps clupeoides]|uniref:transcriptional activator MN1 n=1 Tax=Denticeps clupeoides TaxID=299321 RepID=UPI0010A3D608|nr:transcriptional activator MN1-like [Denticeps clupeoides]XP_028829143.1 transcriptional activator MN1-like [Denticeps clupeoides]
MSSYYNSPCLHVRAPSFAAEPDVNSISIPPPQAFRMGANGETYEFQPRRHLMGSQQASFGPSQDLLPRACQLGTPCPQDDGRAGYGSGSTAHQQGFGRAAEGLAGECFSQQRLLAMTNFQPSGRCNSSHPVPAPCLPLDQSPNRAASFHGVQPLSPDGRHPELHRLPPQATVRPTEFGFPCDPLPGSFEVAGFPVPDSTSDFRYCWRGDQLGGSGYLGISGVSQAPMVFNSKAARQLPQQDAYLEVIENRRRRSLSEELDGSVPYSMVEQQSSPGLPAMFQTSDYSNSTMRNGDACFHGHQVVYPAQRPDTANPGINRQQMIGPTSQQTHPFGHSTLFKRPRFDVGESRGLVNNRASMVDDHLSPSIFPGSVGEFTSQMMDGFSSGPQLLAAGPEQRCQNATIMIKQMASRSQQQRMSLPLSHHGDPTSVGLEFRRQVQNMPQPSPEKKLSLHGNPSQENSWFLGPHQQCRGGAEQIQNGHVGLFRQGLTAVNVLRSNKVPQEGFGHPHDAHSSLEKGMSNEQMQGLGEGTMKQISTPVGRAHHSYFSGLANRHAASHHPPTGLHSSPTRFSPPMEQPSGQTLGKLGAFSLGSSNKGASKDSVFGQSCLAALSTACQNMIASLGAPNLSVTFSKKSQNEAKRKPGQVQEDINGNICSGVHGPGGEYLHCNVPHNSQLPPSGNSNNAATSQNGTSYIGTTEANSVSLDSSMNSRGEDKAPTGSGRGRGKRRRDSGHMSPANFSPPCSSGLGISPKCPSMVNVGVEGQSKTIDASLVSTAFGKPDLRASLDSGIQSVGKSDTFSPRVDYLEDASPTFCEPARTSFGGLGAVGEVHPLEILQAQIQLQRQQFSISEDPSPGGKTGKKGDCQIPQNSDCALANGSSDTGEGSLNTVDLDSLMAEQHATWYGPGIKPQLKAPGFDKCIAFWGSAKDQHDNNQGHG